MGEPPIDEVPGYAFCHSDIALSATPGFVPAGESAVRNDFRRRALWSGDVHL
jgi:hypothetical protein